MNTSLLQPYTSAEIREAFFQMNATKAPRPNGKNAFFFFLIRNFGISWALT